MVIVWIFSMVAGPCGPAISADSNLAIMVTIMIFVVIVIINPPQ